MVQSASILLSPGRRSPAIWIALIAVLVTSTWLISESRVALAIALMEGVPALAMVSLTSLSAVWIVRAFRLTADRCADRLIVAGGVLGVGILSGITLLLGCMGSLSRPVAMGLAVVLSLLGIAALLREFNHGKPSTSTVEQGGLNWLWLLVIPFVAIAAAAACLPPGVLWEEEGRGYDILEYHLAVPRTFATDGRIHFIHNNVFSNFPLNGEMLSLLLMQLRGNAIEAAFMSTFANIALAALFVAAAWWAGSAFGSRCGTISGITAATVPWLVYLSGIAYVETGMLATGMTAFALLLHAIRRGDATWRTFLTAGLLAGISCGFKYTAIPMIAVPLAMLPLWGQGSWSARGRRLAIYAVGVLIAFSPWMIRNIINTRNPVFPLAYSVFGSKPGLWDESTQTIWERATGSSEAENNFAPMWQRILERTIAEPLTGWSLFVLAAIGAIRRRDRWTLALILILVWQFFFWLSFTHIFARFAVVFVLPLVVLAGRSIEGLATQRADQRASDDSRARSASQASAVADEGFVKDAHEKYPGPRASRSTIEPLSYASSTPATQTAALRPPHVLIAVLMLGVATNVYRIASVYYHDTRPGGVRIDAFGHTDWFTRGEWPGTAHWGAINALPAGSRVMLVGEARTFYLLPHCDYAVVFNHHPLADAVQENPEPKAVIAWLRQRGTTHVLVDRGEINRFLRTYGFYEELSPELFDRLEQAGLKRLGDYAVSEGEAPYATLYEVPLHG